MLRPATCARLALAAAAIPCLLGAPSAAGAATVSVVGPTAKVRPLQRPLGAPSARLRAARNEFASFQVVIRAGSRALRDVSVSLARPLSGPAGTIPASQVTIYREAYYRITTPSDVEGARGRWPDALIPTVDPWFHERRNAFPIDVPAYENRVAYVDVLVPRTSRPGRYTGALAIRTSGSVRRLPVSLRVMSFTMPSTATFTGSYKMTDDGPCLAVYGDHAGCMAHEADSWRLKALFARAALDDRISVSYPQFQPLYDDAERQYFEAYDLPLLGGTAQTRLPGARLTSIEVDGDPYLTAWRDEARAHGFERRAYLLACDEPDIFGGWSKCLAAADAAHAEWPQLQTMVTTGITGLNSVGGAGHFNILTPMVQYIDNRAGTAWPGDQMGDYSGFRSAAPNRHVWAYVACASFGCETPDKLRDPAWAGWPSYAIDQPASEARAMGWMAFRYGFTGEFYWRLDYQLPTAWTDQTGFGGTGDGTLFYPGDAAHVGGKDFIPIESLRLKLIRDGYQDYEYLRFLARHGERKAAQTVVDALFPHMYETARSDADVTAARNRLLDLVARVERRQ